jgi:hypothetical protein
MGTAMLRSALAGAMLLLTADVTRGQTPEEVTAAVGEEINAYILCLKTSARDVAKRTDLDEQAVVDQAFSGCGDELRELESATQKPPLSWSADRARGEIGQMNQDLRPVLAEVVQAAR